MNAVSGYKYIYAHDQKPENILLKPDSSLPIYEQLVQAFKESMLNGELSPGDMLPSIRSLAMRNPVLKECSMCTRPPFCQVLQFEASFIRKDAV